MTTSDKSMFKYLGKPRKLVEGDIKVTGHVKYAADLKLPNMLYMRPVLSQYAHAKILDIDKSAAEEMPGVVGVFTADDLPTKDKQITSRNSAILAKETVHWRGQPVAVVVAESELQATDAAEMVFVDYEPLTPVIDLMAAIEADAPLVWPHGLPSAENDLSSAHANVEKGESTGSTLPPNVYDSAHYGRGDCAAGFAAADLVIDRTYRTHMVHQAYMEPHACVAEPDPLGRSLTLHTSTQGSFMVRDEVAALLDLPVSKVKVVPMMFGGGFGAKYGIIEPLAASVAMKLLRPIRLVLSRSEDFLATTPAHGMVVKLKVGARNDGTLTAIETTLYVDNGVFAFPVGSIGATLIGGYYKCDNLSIDVYEVNTNRPPAGAYRAPSAPQITFALESTMDDIARELQIDPLQLRIRNAVDTGDLNGTNTAWPEIGLQDVLAAAQAHPAWQDRQTAENEGIGIALGGWPAFMGPAGAICTVDTDGSVAIQTGAIDISGVNSSFVLVAAETLGVPPEQVEIIQGDTQTGPYTPNSGGSQILYSVAGAIENAAGEAKRKLLEIASDEFEVSAEDVELAEGFAQVRGVPDKRVSIGELVNIGRSRHGGIGPIVGEGNSAKPENAPGFVVHIAKVSIDPATGKVTPRQFVAIQDVGFALNPLLVSGQMEGGAVQCIGFALHEAMRFDADGQLQSGSFMDYDMPRTDSTPMIETVLVEHPSPHGPFGARGIGEPPIIAGAAAIANAVKDATGARMVELPISAEAVWKALHSAR